MGIFNSIHIKSVGQVGICSAETYERLLSLVQISNDILVQLSWRFVDLVTTRINNGIAIVAKWQHTARRTISQSRHLWWLRAGWRAFTGSFTSSRRHGRSLRNGAARSGTSHLAAHSSSVVGVWR
jgi:hypothetical protein